MSKPNLPVASRPELDELHQRVNALLDMPIAKEGDTWPLPLTDKLDDQNVGHRSGSAETEPQPSWP